MIFGRHSIRTTFGLAALAGVLSCTDTTAPTTRLTVTTTVSRPTFRAGDSVTVTVTVFNVGRDSTSINPRWCSIYPFVVTTPNGVEVGPGATLLLCTADLLTKRLAPNESFAISATWTGSATRLDPNVPRLLPPGDYLVGARPFGTVQESIPVAIHVTN